MSEWVSTVSRDTRASRSVVDDLTLSVGAASAWARVLALGTNAAQSGWTIRVDYTLRSAPFVRIADIIRQTGARTNTVLLLADRVEAARRWLAGREVHGYS